MLGLATRGSRLGLGLCAEPSALATMRCVVLRLAIDRLVRHLMIHRQLRRRGLLAGRDARRLACRPTSPRFGAVSGRRVCAAKWRRPYRCVAYSRAELVLQHFELGQHVRWHGCRLLSLDVHHDWKVIARLDIFGAVGPRELGVAERHVCHAPRPVGQCVDAVAQSEQRPVDVGTLSKPRAPVARLGLALRTGEINHGQLPHAGGARVVACL
eukprot:scaffold137747_cov25-Tisochrysis_lutea.AAC.1